MVNCPSALDATFGALSDPTRRGILEHLSQGETRVTDLARPFDISLPAVSRHLRVLETAGLITRARVGREHHIQVDPGPIAAAQDWISLYATVWQHQFDQLDAYLTRTRKPHAGPNTSKRRRP